MVLFRRQRHTSFSGFRPMKARRSYTTLTEATETAATAGDTTSKHPSRCLGVVGRVMTLCLMALRSPLRDSGWRREVMKGLQRWEDDDPILSQSSQEIPVESSPSYVPSTPSEQLHSPDASGDDLT